jgi:hypothetical protein
MSFRSVTSAESTNIIHVFIYSLNFMEVYFEFAVSKHYIFIHINLYLLFLSFSQYL